MKHNYYTLLEIGRNAESEDIKRAYRTKAKQFHPDVNNSPKANQLFILLNLAYETLLNEHKRRLYDLKLDYAISSTLEKQRKNESEAVPVKNKKYPHGKFNRSHVSKNKMSGKTETVHSEENPYQNAPIMYTLFFICGMFSGFLILIVTIIGTFRHYWPSPFGLIAIPGIILIRDGWKGFMGKTTLVGILVKAFSKEVKPQK